MKCNECKGTGIAEYIDVWARPCDACNGEGVINMATQLEMPDCYHKAEPGEPKFTLLARDPLAPFLVAMWAALRAGDTASAVSIFADTVADPAYRYRTGEADSPEKIADASDIANHMNKWRGDKGLEVFGLHTV